MDTRGVIRLGYPSDDTVDPDDIENILTEYCGLWRGVGLKLGLKVSVLNNIEEDHHGQRKRFQKTLDAWMGQCQDEATYGALELGITNANRVKLGLKKLPEMPKELTTQTTPTSNSDQPRHNRNNTNTELNNAGATSGPPVPVLESIPSNPELVGDGNWPTIAMQQLDELSERMSGLPPPDATDANGLPIYKMKENPRGIAIIINNRNFICGPPERIGTDKDAEALVKLFTYLRFFTNRYDNLTVAEMERKLKEVAKLNHQRFDCLMVAILTHGLEGELYGTDGTISTAWLLHLLDGKRCPTLVGKPKIFFIQACRGEAKDRGANIINGMDLADSGSLPTMSDYLLSYSTIPGHVSWRNSKTGSWFIYTLANVFKENATKEHLIDMLTEVNRKVAALEIGGGIYKQQPEPVTHLQKKLYFFPGQ